jgi:hypothetical protein
MSLLLQLASEFLLASQELKIVVVSIIFMGDRINWDTVLWGCFRWAFRLWGVCGFKVRALVHPLNEVQQALAAHLGQPGPHFVPGGGIHGAEGGQALGHALKVFVVAEAVNASQPLLQGLIGQQLIACGPGNIGVDQKLPLVF